LKLDIFFDFDSDLKNRFTEYFEEWPKKVERFFKIAQQICGTGYFFLILTAI
jgi:hypothetical protein